MNEPFTKAKIISILSAILEGEPQPFSRTVSVPISLVKDAIVILNDVSERDRFAMEYGEWLLVNYTWEKQLWIPYEKLLSEFKQSKEV